MAINPPIERRRAPRNEADQLITFRRGLQTFANDETLELLATEATLTGDQYAEVRREQRVRATFGSLVTA